MALDRDIDIVCPVEKATLKFDKGSAAFMCPVCGAHYPFETGVLKLLSASSPFYEDAYKNQIRYLPRSERAIDVWPLWIIRSGYLWATRKYVSSGSTVVELGCAGGVAYFGRRYRMVGCDVSFSSLRENAMGYRAKIQVDATAIIPLPERSADAIVSSYFWEHLTDTQKGHLLQECRRVLKPNGKLIFLFDVETKNPLLRLFLSRQPERYRRLFLESDEHVGYRPFAATVQLMRENGFRIRAYLGNEKTIFMDPSVYSKLSQWDQYTDRVFSLLGRLGQSPWIYPYSALVRIIDATFGAVLPMSWSRTATIVAERG